MFYIKPNLKNMSQGARLEYIREVRHMTKEDVAAYFGFRGKEPNKTIREYENNTTSPSPSRLEELAKLYEVSVDAIRKYDFTYKIEDNSLSIDFKNEKSTDSKYKFHFEEENLIIEGTNGKFTFKKVEEKKK
ncbi:MAG: helix-turn-helix domain-containing protein [Bacilli bacterium]|nr:helix-turn-helix domain-containing protein [Bacilli bacterium]